MTTKAEAKAAVEALRGYHNAAACDDDYVFPDDAVSLLADVADYIEGETDA